MILVHLEGRDSKVDSASRSAITAARQLATQTGSTVAVLVTGHHVESLAFNAAKFGVARVYVVDDQRLEHLLPDVTAKAVVQVARQSAATTVIGPATASGKSIMPRVAALLDAAMAPDIVNILPGPTFKRPMFSGKLYQQVQLLTAVHVLTVRSSAFSPVAEADVLAPCEPILLDAAIVSKMRLGTREQSVTVRPSLTEAKVVVSGGRGVKDAAGFAQMIEPLADALGAAIGASRAVVDSGWVSNDLQVGQTGKQVAPEVYIAVGISGAIQHLAGMRTSRTIVAINKDPDAPIFGVADYGIVGDLFEICPALVAEIGAARAT